MPVRGRGAAYRAVTLVIQVFVAAALTAVVVVYGGQVFFRYALNTPLLWADELASILLVWISFGGAALAMQRGEHMAIELVPELLPARFRDVLATVAHVLSAAFLIILTALGWTVVLGTMDQRGVSVPLPRGVVYLPALVSVAFMAAVAAGRGVAALAGLFRSAR